MHANLASTKKLAKSRGSRLRWIASAILLGLGACQSGSLTANHGGSTMGGAPGMGGLATGGTHGNGGVTGAAGAAGAAGAMSGSEVVHDAGGIIGMGGADSVDVPLASGGVLGTGGMAGTGGERGMDEGADDRGIDEGLLEGEIDASAGEGGSLPLGLCSDGLVDGMNCIPHSQPCVKDARVCKCAPIYVCSPVCYEALHWGRWTCDDTTPDAGIANAPDGES